jgi:hypothetical protein
VTDPKISGDIPTKDTMIPIWNLNFTAAEYLLQPRELLVIIGSLLSCFKNRIWNSDSELL